MHTPTIARARKVSIFSNCDARRARNARVASTSGRERARLSAHCLNAIERARARAAHSRAAQRWTTLVDDESTRSIDSRVRTFGGGNICNDRRRRRNGEGGGGGVSSRARRGKRNFGRNRNRRQSACG